MRSTLQGRIGPCVLVFLWTVLAAGGFLLAGKYEWTPGLQTWVPHRGPARSLLIALHPNCPCSLALLRELKPLLATAGRPVPLRALLYTHPSLPQQSPLLQELQQFPEIEIISDLHGDRARQLGLHTSGHLIAYGTSGEILFSGGITAGRLSNSPGPAAGILAGILRGRSSIAAKFPVFGCSLRGNGA